MKITVVGPTGNDLFADNVRAGLLALGHEVSVANVRSVRSRSRRLNNAIGVASAQSAALEMQLQKTILAECRRFRPDLVINLQGSLRPEVVGMLKGQGARVVLWFPDAVSNLGKHQMFMAPYDRLFFKNPLLVQQLKDVYELPVTYLPEAANTQIHRPTCSYGSDPVIVVAGNIHPTRAILLERLIADGIPVVVYGAPLAAWIKAPQIRRRHAGKYVHGIEKATVFRQSRGVLNNLHPAEFAGANCRLFEIAASGGVALTEWRAGMNALFERNREVMSFSTYSELVSLCQRLLEHPSNGMGVADAAADRARAEHSYEARLMAMLDDLEKG